MDPTFIIYTPQAVRILLSSVPLVPSAALVPAAAVPGMVRTHGSWASSMGGIQDPVRGHSGPGGCAAPSGEPRRGLCSTC